MAAPKFPVSHLLAADTMPLLLVCKEQHPKDARKGVQTWTQKVPGPSRTCSSSISATTNLM
jgi:hypothetical protein